MRLKSDLLSSVILLTAVGVCGTYLLNRNGVTDSSILISSIFIIILILSIIDYALHSLEFTIDEKGITVFHFTRKILYFSWDQIVTIGTIHQSVLHHGQSNIYVSWRSADEIRTEYTSMYPHFHDSAFMLSSKYVINHSIVKKDYHFKESDGYFLILKTCYANFGVDKILSALMNSSRQYAIAHNSAPAKIYRISRN